MQATPAQWIAVVSGVVGFFLIIPGKIIYDNAKRLRPVARVTFAGTVPAIYCTSMFVGFYYTSRLLDNVLRGYAPYAGMLISLSLATLVASLWYRCLKDGLQD